MPRVHTRVYVQSSSPSRLPRRRTTGEAKTNNNTHNTLIKIVWCAVEVTAAGTTTHHLITFNVKCYLLTSMMVDPPSGRYGFCVAFPLCEHTLSQTRWMSRACVKCVPVWGRVLGWWGEGIGGRPLWQSSKSIVDVFGVDCVYASIVELYRHTRQH